MYPERVLPVLMHTLLISLSVVVPHPDSTPEHSQQGARTWLMIDCGSTSLGLR